MSDFRRAYNNLDEIIRTHYDELDIKHLGEINFDGDNTLHLFTEAIKGRIKVREFDWWPFFSDLEFTSKDMKYYTSLLSLLQPFINHPLQEENTYIQTLEDSRFMSTASILFQLFYNYWDRIGDLLDAFISTELGETRVYFTSVINVLKAKYPKSDSMKELEELYNDHLQSLFSERKNIVHYTQLSGRIFTGILNNLHDDEVLKAYEKEKDSFPSFFVEQLSHAHEGFRIACNLINELSQSKLIKKTEIKSEA